MQMIEFVNPTGRIVVLTGPNKEQVQLGKFERRILPAWYRKYVPRYLKEVRAVNAQTAVVPAVIPQRPNRPRDPKTHKGPNLVLAAQERLKKAQERETRRKHLAAARDAAKVGTRRKLTVAHTRRVVGSTSMTGSRAASHFDDVIKRLKFPISNDIGIGILSYNRLGCVKRLVESIRRYTDLNRTTIIISDESSDQDTIKYLKTLTDITVLFNDKRIGIAGNTNRLMRCLARFNYKIIMNDDVEVLNNGWENVYANAMAGTHMHHFCFRQDGIYGAKSSDGVQSTISGYRIQTITDKPQGVVLAYDHVAFQKVGYFDENFGIYGMEHVDWSNRVTLSGIQPAGYHDVIGSGNFYKLHKEQSAVDDRTRHLAESRKKFEKVRSDKSRIYVKPSKQSEVPGVTYIVPFRGVDRTNAIRIVLMNIKAQRFPLIQVVMVEQDDSSRHTIAPFASIDYILAENVEPGQPFAKSLAFNLGTTLARFDKMILHDADMIVQHDYTAIMDELMNNHDGVHIGKNVLYMSRRSTEKVFQTAKFTPDLSVERTVGYFEGGSLGCKRNTYVKIGGFNERFVGYGCFCPDNYVLTMAGYKPIEDVLATDLVYTHEGIFRPIELRCHKYVGIVLDIFVPGRLPIKGVTPEHPFLIKSGDEWQWRRADQLVVGDQILDTDFLPELSYQFLQGLTDMNIEFLLGGLCDGDANHSRGSEKRVIYHTSNINMAMLASGLMRKIGIAHSFGRRSGGALKGSAKWGYDLCVNREFEHKLQMAYPKAPFIGSNSIGRTKFGKVYDVKMRPYDGLVYNFEVQEDHSYVVDGLVVHNCEDCEFFARLASVPTFHNQRTIDLIHLWHGRTNDWKSSHVRNKEIEATIYKRPMQDRITDQARILSNKYGLKPR